jgi:DNA repair protein SbcD/Mre11
MKIAITADLHLRTMENTPERYNALDNILSQCVSQEINLLIIAGDLFDKDQSVFSDFDNICKKTKYKKINIIVIPGNHDPKLAGKNIIAKNVEIIEIAKLVSVDDEWDFMFIPYQNNKKMGEVIQSITSHNIKRKLVIVGHGDFIDSIRDVSPDEPGNYMPTTRKDLEIFQPTRMFLGHIHKANIGKTVSNPGSPIGLDITETGYRSFIIFDTNSNTISQERIDCDRLYFQTSLVVFPVKNGEELLRDSIKTNIKNWGISKKDEKKAIIRVNIAGFSPDRKSLQKLLSKEFTDYELNEEISLDEVQSGGDEERNYILEKSLEELNILNEELKIDGLEHNIYLSLLDQVYGD